MPTTATNTYGVTDIQPYINPEDAMESIVNVKLAASTTFVAGTVLGRVTSGGAYAAYASGNSDGTQVAVGILKTGGTTDASGYFTGQFGEAIKEAPMFTQGAFKVADLTGFDAAGAANMGGHIVKGVTSADDIFFF